MTHKIWPPPVGTLLILTDADRAGIRRWENGDVMLVVSSEATTTNEAARVTRLRDHGHWYYNMRPRWCRPLEETDNDQA